MKTDPAPDTLTSDLPASVAADIAIYLAHTAAGVSMRMIAASLGRQPSTIMRAVRRIEARRDDPLFDQLLCALEADGDTALFPFPTDQPESSMSSAKTSSAAKSPTKPQQATLRRLSEPDAFLMVAKGAEKAGVFCRTNQFRRPLALITLDEAMLLLSRDWVKCIRKSDLSTKYEISAAGRAALRRSVAETSPQMTEGFAEAPSPFTAQHQSYGARRIANIHTGKIETVSVNLGESPLGWLARRKNSKGDALLSPEEIEAGERLREDFELAQIGPKVGQDWRRFLTAGDKPSGTGRTPSEGPMFARERVAGALEALGPGLSDVALRVCCFLEGLEATEKRMGWAARSGKVVLKLALQRLVAHYGLMRPGDRAA